MMNEINCLPKCLLVDDLEENIIALKGLCKMKR